MCVCIHFENDTSLNFERICWVGKFDRISENFAKSFQECMTNKFFDTLRIFKIFSPRRPLTHYSLTTLTLDAGV